MIVPIECVFGLIPHEAFDFGMIVPFGPSFALELAQVHVFGMIVPVSEGMADGETRQN